MFGRQEGVMMIGCLGQSRAAQDTDVVARAVAAVALAALAVIHVVDPPGTLSLTPLVGFGYLGIIAAATLVGAGWGAWQAWTRGAHRPRRPSVVRVLPGSPAGADDHDQPLHPVQ
jgi:hypothetical protein